jgi:hypothetical protein
MHLNKDIKMKREKEMIDNRMVKDSHQEGIGRVLQRKEEKDRSTKPCSGKMGKDGGNEKRDWNRDHGSMTPKKA